MPTMLAARLHEIGKPMQLEQVPIPTPRPTDVVVQVKACNVVPNLKNVLATYAEWFPYLPLPQLPAIFGLDSAGVVTAGRRARSPTSRSATGSTSTPACPADPAGPAAAARTRTAPATPSWATSRSAPTVRQLFDAYPYGGLAEYLTAPQRNLVNLPDSVTFEQGARFGYLGTAYSALRKAGAGPGRTVLIDGISGTLGLGACLIALGLGVTRILGTGRNADLLDDVKAIAPGPHRRAARRRRRTCRDWVREHTDGEGVDIVIDAVGPGAPAEAMLEAIDHARAAAASSSTSAA